MSSYYQMQIDVDVFDFAQLRSAAAAQAVKEGMSAAEWERMRSENASPVAADIHMLFDPGAIDNSGISIVSAEVEYTGGDVSPEESPEGKL